MGFLETLGGAVILGVLVLNGAVRVRLDLSEQQRGAYVFLSWRLLGVPKR